MENARGAIDVVVDTFGGLSLETGAPDTPKGAASDCQDVIFQPGSVRSRDCLHKILSPAISGNPSVTYTESFVQPDETELNLLFDSGGNLWKTATNGSMRTLIKQLVAASYINSVSAFGRKYLAVNDGLHGSDIPFQFDGTNFDRVSQDGAGAPPAAVNFSPSSVAIVSTGSGVPIALISATCTDPHDVYRGPSLPPLTLYDTVTYVASGAHGLSVGDVVAISGMAPDTFNIYNRNATSVLSVLSSISFTADYGGELRTSAAGGTMTAQGPSIQRQANIATAYTGTSHNFQAGWRVTISDISNETIATISTVARVGSVVTVTTSAAHGIPQGANVQIDGVVDSSFDVASTKVTSATSTTFTYTQDDTDASSTAGSVLDIFDGTFRITSTPTATSFTYNNTGPDDLTNDAGTASIAGQIGTGMHGVVVMFLTRQGYITKPSPATTFVAVGNGQVLLTSLPIGPANVIARIVAFTPAGGANYFYIPTDVSQGGEVTVTSTVVNDNTSTSALFDFSDNALMAATAIDIPGNNLFALVVLGPCLGFFQYAARLFAWGERNKVQNFLNMGFDGGYLAGNPTVPTGWSNSTTDGGGLFNGGAWDSGQAWLITGDGGVSQRGLLTQSAFQDENGIPIVLPNTRYIFRLWARSTASAGSIVARFNSAGSGILATATIPISSFNSVGNFAEANFDTALPATVPSDTQLEVFVINQGIGDVAILDELEIVYRDNPYTDTIFRGSYVQNPESFDGVTGVLGALGDPSAIRAPFELRNNFYFNTAQRLQVTADNGTGEPSTWSIQEVEKVGALSSRASAPSAEGEDWQFIASRGGVYIFSGSTPIKISQEIQQSANGIPGWEDINWEAQKTIWMVNDSVRRRLYVAVPLNNEEAPPWTSPSVLFVLDYRYLESAEAIAFASPLRNDGRGSLTTFDLSRKWTRWNCFLDCGAIVSQGNNQTNFVVGSGNGAAPGDSPAFGNVYYFDPAKFTDDDYGVISPFYTTAFLDPNNEAQAIGIGVHRQQACYLTTFITGIGNMLITPYVDDLQNVWSPTPLLPMALTRTFDTEIGLNVLGNRIAYKYAPQPLDGETDVFFNLSELTVTYRPDPWSPVGGSWADAFSFLVQENGPKFLLEDSNTNAILLQ